MAEVKWIKLTTDMFDNRKIKHLRKLPDGDKVVLIWVMLLTMAGRCNAGGMIFLTENIPYTPKMLADELDFEESVISMALQALAELEMIVMDGAFFYIAGWEEYQNIDGMERIREQTRLRVARHRAKLPSNVTGNVTVTPSNATEEDKEEDKERDKEKDIERDKEGDIEKNNSYQKIANLFNTICTSYPSVKSLSAARKKALRARLSTYSEADFVTLFEKAEASSFLKGNNNRDWQANFDWLIKDANMAKVLDGNYDDKQKKQEDSFSMISEWVKEKENGV